MGSKSEVAESAVLNIYQKLAKIRKPVEVLKKNKAGYGYKYVTEEEILSRISGLMERYGVSLVPRIIPGTTKVEPYHYIKTKSDKTGKFYDEHCNEILVQADMEWVWVDNDNPNNSIVVPWTLVGQQAEASQSFGSALTYASRYFMLKYFNVATSDEDPEVFKLKKKEAEQQEEREIVEEIINKVHELIEARLAEYPDDRLEVAKITKRIVKSTNYYEVQDAETATKLLSALEKKFSEKGDKE